MSIMPSLPPQHLVQCQHSQDLIKKHEVGKLCARVQEGRESLLRGSREQRGSREPRESRAPRRRPDQPVCQGDLQRDLSS